MTGCDLCGVGPEDECSMECPSRLLDSIPADCAVSSDVNLYEGVHLIQWWRGGTIEGDTDPAYLETGLAELAEECAAADTDNRWDDYADQPDPRRPAVNLPYSL